MVRKRLQSEQSKSHQQKTAGANQPHCLLGPLKGRTEHESILVVVKPGGRSDFPGAAGVTAARQGWIRTELSPFPLRAAPPENQTISEPMLILQDQP